MKTMYVIVLSLLATRTLCAQTEPRMVTLSGTLVHATKQTPRVVRVNFLNPFQPNAQSAAFDGNHSFCLREEMLFTQNITVQYNGTFINLYVAPGDSVHITIDADLLTRPDFEWISFQGNHAEWSKQLNNWYHTLGKIPYKKYDLTLPPQQMRIAVEMDYDRYMSEFAKYAATHTIDTVIKQWVASDVKYILSNWIMDYTQSTGLTLAQQREKIQVFADPFFDIYNASNFKSMMFPYHLAAYMHDITRTDPEVLSVGQSGTEKEKIQAALRRIQKEPAGINRDYMLFYFLSKQVNRSASILDSIGDTRPYFTNPVAYRYLQRYAANALHPQFEKVALEGVFYLDHTSKKQSLPPGDLFDYLVRKHPGKVLYVDVYATWCGPCIEEMKYARLLQASLQQTDVVFVNLCLQSDLEKWKALLTKEQLHGENLFLDEDATKLFMANYRLSGFPSYLLVNREGKIVTNTAPRPSDGKTLADAIERCLR